jgi:hypothetical protein
MECSRGDVNVVDGHPGNLTALPSIDHTSLLTYSGSGSCCTEYCNGSGRIVLLDAEVLTLSCDTKV